MFRYLFISISILQPLMLSAAAAEKDIKPKVFSARLPTLRIDGTEIPMFGKWSNKLIDPKEFSSGTIWIKKASVRVVDEETGELNEDYFCHFHVGGEGYKSYDKRRFLGAHAGNSSMDFPDGYAVAMKLDPGKPLYLFGMSADYAKRGIPKSVHFEVDISYYDDADAKVLGLRDLDFEFVVVKSSADGIASFKELVKKNVNRRSAHGGKLRHSEYGGIIHWFVPPGGHEYRTVINDQIPGLKNGDVRLHYVHLHLHSYGSWGEIYDATEKRTIWRGYAKTYPDRSVLASIERFTSKEGIVLKTDHSYEAIARYDNPTGKDISAMLTMRMFYRPEK